MSLSANSIVCTQLSRPRPTPPAYPLGKGAGGGGGGITWIYTTIYTNLVNLRIGFDLKTTVARPSWIQGHDVEDPPRTFSQDLSSTVPSCSAYS